MDDCAEMPKRFSPTRRLSQASVPAPRWPGRISASGPPCLNARRAGRRRRRAAACLSAAGQRAAAPGGVTRLHPHRQVCRRAGRAVTTVTTRSRLSGIGEGRYLSMDVRADSSGWVDRHLRGARAVRTGWAAKLGAMALRDPSGTRPDALPVVDDGNQPVGRVASTPRSARRATVIGRYVVITPIASVCRVGLTTISPLAWGRVGDQPRRRPSGRVQLGRRVDRSVG